MFGLYKQLDGKSTQFPSCPKAINLLQVTILRAVKVIQVLGSCGVTSRYRTKNRFGPLLDAVFGRDKIGDHVMVILVNIYTAAKPPYVVIL